MNPVLRRMIGCAVVAAALLGLGACSSLTKVVRFIDGQDRIEMAGSTAAVTALVPEDLDVFDESLAANAGTSQDNSPPGALTENTASPQVYVGKALPAPSPLERSGQRPVASGEVLRSEAKKPATKKKALAEPASATEALVVEDKGISKTHTDKKTSLLPSAQPPESAELTGRVLVKVDAKIEGEISNASLVRLIPKQHSPLFVLQKKGASAEHENAMDRGETLIVDMKDKRYQPKYLTSRKNDTVIFTNSDKIRHNVFSRSGKNAFDLGTYAGGKKRGVSFKEPGIVKVYCNIHPDMATFVSVIEEGYSTISDDNGHFTFSDIPAGDYVLEAWNIRGSVEAAVSVKAGRKNQVELVVSVLDPEFLEHSNKFGEKYPDKPLLFGDEFY